MRPAFSSIVIVVVAFVLASCTSDTSPPETLPDATDATPPTTLDPAVAAWCGIEQSPFELDPADPSSVEAGFTQNLAFDLVRAERAPAEIEDALDTLVAETERITAVLETNGWELLSDEVQSQVDLPPEAQAAVDEVYRFEVEVCGKPDTRFAEGD